jgi:hypothetical protein
MNIPLVFIASKGKAFDDATSVHNSQISFIQNLKGWMYIGIDGQF